MPPTSRRTDRPKASLGVSDPPLQAADRPGGRPRGVAHAQTGAVGLPGRCGPGANLITVMFSPALLQHRRSVRCSRRCSCCSRNGKGDPMALIKPRTRGKQLVRHRTRLDHETNETLYAYARFIGESTEYVLNQVIDTVLGKDKDYLQWRTSHTESFVPRGAGARGLGPAGGTRRRVTPASGGA